MPHRGDGDHPLVGGAFVLAAIVALAMIGAAALVAIFAFGRGSGDATPFVSALIGFLAPVVVALIALLRIERVERSSSEIEERLDGKMAEQIRQAYEEYAATQPRNRRRDDAGRPHRADDPPSA